MKTPYYITRIRSELVTRISRNPKYSLRAFAKSLGLEPSVLSQILSGKRFPSERLAEGLFSRLNLAPREQDEFLRSLGLAKIERGLKRISPSLRKRSLSTPAGEHAPGLISHEDFQVMAEWYFTAILELSYVEGFKNDPAWIASRLGLTELQSRLAVSTLIEKGMLKRKGRSLVKSNRVLATADVKNSSIAHRLRQKQILEKAVVSLESDPIAIRNHTAATFATHPDRIAEAKRRIDRFTDEIMEFLETGPKTHVYEIAIQLFPLSQESK